VAKFLVAEHDPTAWKTGTWIWINDIRKFMRYFFAHFVA
jgi:hypothetical protein